MKKNRHKYLYLLLIPFVAACTWQIPQTVAVKTNAEYAFRLGTIKKSFADLFTAESINKMISDMANSSDSSSSSGSSGSILKNSSESSSSSSSSALSGLSNMKIYDYNPDNSNYYQYLIDLPFNKMEFDVSKMIPENLDFESTLGSAIQSPLEAQNITVPNLNEYLNQSFPVTLPDFSNEILGNITFESLDFPVMDSSELNGSLSKDPIPVKIGAGGEGNKIGTIDFSSGALELVFTPKEEMPAMQTNLQIHMSCAADGSSDYSEVSSSGDPVLLSTTQGVSTTISIPLTDKSITTNMILSFGGSTFQASGSTPGYYKYNISVHFTSETAIKQITGVTMALDQSINLNQSLPATGNDMIHSCTIGEGGLYLTCPLPDGWTGINLTPTLELTGGFNADIDDFSDIPSDDTHYIANPVLNKKLNLNGKSYSNAAINVTTSIDIALENATLVFSSGEQTLNINIAGDIKSIAEAIINLKSVLYNSETGKSNLSYEITYDLDSSGTTVSDYIYSITFLENTGLSIPYSNTLPEGNDITIKYYSDFFGFGSSSSPLSGTIQCFGNQTETVTNEDGTTSTQNKTGKLDILTDSTKEIFPATDHVIDFTVQMGLPGQASLPDELKASEDAEYYGVLKNIELGATYTIDIKSPKAAINWQEIKINKSVLGDTLKDKSIDTGFDTSTMLSSISSSLAESGLIESLKLPEIPLYIYCVLPDFEAFKGLTFSGTMSAFKKNSETGEESTPIDIFNGDIGTLTAIPELVTNDKNVVTEKPSTDTGKVSAYINSISTLFNDKNKGSLNIEYNIDIGGSDKTYFTITKEMYDDLMNVASSETPSTSIELLARLILPMELTIEPSDGTDKVSLDIMKIINGDKEAGDLFGRSEATNMDDIEKYMNLVKKATLNYSFANELLKYSNNNNISIKFDPKIEGVSAKSMNTGSGKLDITMEEFSKMMKQYPFTPDLVIEIPEGQMQLLRKAEIGINTSISVTTDGTISIFGTPDSLINGGN